jgi:hypothetical protein
MDSTDRMACSYENDNERSVSIKEGFFELNNYQLLKRTLVHGVNKVVDLLAKRI